MAREGERAQAGGVVFRERDGHIEILVVSTRDRKTWIFPKGHVEGDEGLLEAALREVREESGVVGAAVALLEPSSFRNEGRDVPVRYVVVRALEEGPLEEDRDKEWLDPQTALVRLTHEDTRAVLASALLLLAKSAAPASTGIELSVSAEAAARPISARTPDASIGLIAVVATAGLVTLVPGVSPALAFAVIAVYAVLAIVRRHDTRTAAIAVAATAVGGVTASFLHTHASAGFAIGFAIAAILAGVAAAMARGSR
jgi:8-oxo-dGTP pyrophosphatase MutT (NUDIX family)